MSDVVAGGRVWKLDLNHAEQIVLLALAHHGDHDGGRIFPGMKLVAWDCGYSVRQVRRIIDSMLAKGYLRLEATDYGKYRTNLYSIQWAAIPKKKPPEHLEEYWQAKDKMSPPSNKEGEEIQDESGDISPGGGDIQVSANPAIHPAVNFKDEEEARARNEKFSGPVTKAHSARRAAHPSDKQPKEGASPPDLPLPDDSEGLADIEALLADPVLYALAEAAMNVTSRDLHTLRAVECAALAETRASWGTRISPQRIRQVQAKMKLPRVDPIQEPVAYLVTTLDAAAKEPLAGSNGHTNGTRARAAPNGHKGNGNGQAAYNGLDPKEYMEPGGKYTAMFNPAVVPRRVVKTGGGSGGS